LTAYISTKAINAYFSYYNSSDLDMDSLNARLTMPIIAATFHSPITCMLRRLIPSGNISLLHRMKKTAIIRLKKTN
jgi:hypothetical protein